MKPIKIFRYPGSKAKLLPGILPAIEKLLQTRSTFCDAFVGGGSVLIRIAQLYPDIKLMCNDKDDFVFSFWKIMADGTDADIKALQTLISQTPTIKLFYELRQTEPQSIVEAAYRAIFFNRCSYTGDMRRSSSPQGGRKQLSQYTIGCRYNAPKLIKQIDTIHQLLAGRLVASNQDINDYEVLRDPNIGCYLDPPYVKMGHQLYNFSMKLAEYQQLAANLKNTSNWVLSLDNCEEVREMYQWANIDYIDVSYCIRGSKINWHKTKEVLITP